MSLASQVSTTPPREKSGPDIDRRYQYQALWGLALLLKQHNETADYAIVFEFHDDVALFESSTEPSSIRFYQIKTKATPGGWALQKLMERKASSKKGSVSTKASFIDKMFENVNKFHPKVISADLVSNQICSFYNKKDNFLFSECDPDDYKKIVEAIQKRYPGATTGQIGLLGFQRSHLSLPDATAHIKGKLHEFVYENLGSVKCNLDVIYTAVVEECRRRTTFVGTCDNFEQILKYKGITRENVIFWLDTISAENRAPEWVVVASSLVEYNFSRKIAIGRQYSIYRSAVLDVGNVAIIRVRKKIRQEIDIIGDKELKTLDQAVDFLCVKCEDIAIKYLTPFSADKLRAMIIYEIYADNQD